VYGKLFETMYDGTLASDWQALVTFQQMIVLCDADGVLDVTPEALHRRTGIPLDVIKAGIKALEAPDPRSRTPDCNGVRIIRIDEHRDWGWQLVNHEKYKSLTDSDTKRAQTRERVRRYRERKSNADVTPVTHGNASKRHTDTDTDKEDLCASATHFDRFWEAYPRKTNKKQARELWKRKKLDARVDLLLEAVRRHCQSEQWQTPSLIPHPSTWLRNERWEDELSENATAGGPL